MLCCNENYFVTVKVMIKVMVSIRVGVKLCYTRFQ
jgi:hypothetical protein